MALTLQTILKLNTGPFMRGARQASGAMNDMSKKGRTPGGGAGHSDRMAKGMQSLGKGMRRLAVTLAAVQLGIAAVGVSGIMAAGRMEMLKLQLANLSSSAKDFKEQWAQSMRVFLTSPLELEPVVKARALLSAFGVKGEKSLRAVASAAAALQRPVDDVVRAVGSMETESFRRLGIEVRKVGEQFTFSFLNKGGKSLKVVANGIKEARKAAISVMDIKFGGALELAAKTWEGAMSTFKGVRMFALAAMFDPIKERAVPILLTLNRKILDLAQSGALTRFGLKVVRTFEKIISITISTWKAIHNFAQGSGGTLLKWAGIFGGIGLAFKKGIALPIIMSVAKIGKVLFNGLVMPFGSALAIIATFVASFNIVKALEKTFDLSGIIARFTAQANHLGAMFANLIKNIADPEGFKAGAEKLAREYEEMMARMQPEGNGESLSENMKAQVKETMKLAVKMSELLESELGELGLVQDFAKLIADLQNIPQIVLPKLELELPDFGKGVRDGIRDAFRRKLQGDVFRLSRDKPAFRNKLQANAIGRILKQFEVHKNPQIGEQQKKLDRISKNTQHTADSLQSLISNGALVW